MHAEHTRKCLAIHADQGIKGEQVVNVMDRLLFERGSPPAKIRVDNGPEFISRALDHWAYINRKRCAGTLQALKFQGMS